MRSRTYTLAAVAVGLLLSPPNLCGQLRTDTLEHGGLDREYRTFIPQAFTPNMPAVLIFHGSWPEEGQWTIDYTQLNRVADTAGFIAVYPQSVPDRWHAGGGVSPEPPVDDLGFVEALIDTLADRYEINRARVYICGLNYGGGMVIQCAFQIADRFAAGAIVNAFFTQRQVDNRTLSRPFPWLMCMGTAHPAYGGVPSVLWGAEETLEWWLQLNNCTLPGDTARLPDLDPADGCTVEKISFAFSPHGAPVAYYKIINGGMAWPGSSGSYAWEGNKNMDMDAGVEIWEFFKDISNPFVTSSDIPSRNAVPSAFGLMQNYPNPFNPSTSIEYALPHAGNATLDIYTILGEKVATIVDGDHPAGTFTTTWDASGLPSSVYFYRLSAGDYVQIKKMVLVK